MKDKFNLKEIITLSVTLFLICSLAAVVLGFANSITETKIDENNKAALEKSLKVTMPEASDFQKMFEDGVVPDAEVFSDVGKNTDVYEAKDSDGNVVGWCVTTVVNGYKPGISLVIGINKDLTVSAIDIPPSHSETPGLGGNITTDWFKARFAGKSSVVIVKRPASADNEVQAITGATMSSRAVAEGVNKSLEIVKAISEEGDEPENE